MDILIFWISLELGKTLCYPITCAEAIKYEITRDVEVEPEVTVDEIVVEKPDETEQ